MVDKKGKLIVIAGNLVDNVTNISNFLEARGYKTVWAYNGIDALELCKESKPALLIIDIKLDGMSGFEVAKNLINQKFLFMSADEDLLAIARRFEGSIGSIKKPVDLEEMLEIIKKKIK